MVSELYIKINKKTNDTNVRVRVKVGLVAANPPPFVRITIQRVWFTRGWEIQKFTGVGLYIYIYIWTLNSSARYPSTANSNPTRGRKRKKKRMYQTPQLTPWPSKKKARWRYQSRRFIVSTIVDKRPPIDFLCMCMGS